ncbi:KAP family P-loop NTPase fold protein [Enterovibrio norvegicus]|uniref:KAP family P-loop NTPase fold protein n=1 Tax=Enterovibrio norvegicus TaxID=188144 RepID=UPI000CBF328B|nr:P-loop NTPase fold protein [Enterovibrio norvegicus]PMN72540.1 hypothetical protein BCT27_14150 [Enterovibrio norvegicus]
MSNQAYKNAKYGSWMQDYTFDNCKLDRKQYGEFLANYLNGELDGFVLNLNGAWGTGKTEFLKRLYTHLQTQKHPVVYIDAWESDFSKDPLTVVASELLNQLEALNDGIGNDETMTAVKSFVGRALKGTAVASAGFISHKLLGDAGIGMEGIKTFVEGDQDNYVDNLKDHYSNQVEAIANIREKLSVLAEVLEQNYDAKLPVIVLVDELDRCRPSYAIEMLEIIKHFFTTKNFVFVIGNDTEQLSCSIKAVYGIDFDSKQYLKRFFNRQAALPAPDIHKYIETKHLEIISFDNIHLFPIYGHVTSEIDLIRRTMADIAKGYDLKIRDLDQLWAKVKSCLAHINASNPDKPGKHYVNICALIIGLIEQDKGYRAFSERTKHQCAHEIPPNNFSIEDDLTINDLVKGSMRYVVKSLENIRDPYGDWTQTHVLPTYISYKQEVQTTNCSDVRRNFFNTLNDAKQNAEQTTTRKYWLWEDLKKVIELAGHIE